MPRLWEFHQASPPSQTATAITTGAWYPSSWRDLYNTRTHVTAKRLYDRSLSKHCPSRSQYSSFHCSKDASISRTSYATIAKKLRTMLTRFRLFHSLRSTYRTHITSSTSRTSAARALAAAVFYQDLAGLVKAQRVTNILAPFDLLLLVAAGANHIWRRCFDRSSLQRECCFWWSLSQLSYLTCPDVATAFCEKSSTMNSI